MIIDFHAKFFISRNCFVLRTSQRKEAETQGVVCVLAFLLSSLFFLATAQRRNVRP